MEAAMKQAVAPTPTAEAVPHADMANAIRFLSADAVQAANSGHPGMPMGMADVATVLFSKYLKFDASAPDWADRDRFVLSAGHGSMLLYSLLHLTGYEGVTIDQLKNFRQLGSMTAGHPEYGHMPGIETTTGPLGQGIATAVGMAMAEKMLAARYGDSVVDHNTYVIAGDGCLMEGISQEAISLAGHLGLGKLIVLWDDNNISIDGPVTLSASDNQQMRFEASNWHVQSIDGHDPFAIDKAIQAAKAETGKPSLIACRTTIGFGAPTKAGTAATHGAPLGEEELAGAREAMGWHNAPFDIPEDCLTAWRTIGSRGAAARAEWQNRLNGIDAADKAEFERRMKGDLPANWKQAVIEHKKALSADAPKMATRVASQKALDAIFAAVPELLGGSADLTGSNNTKAQGQNAVSPADFSGSYVHWGIREHGMAAAMNGIALHGGFVPYGGTFLVFTDYCRPSMRLSALMNQRVIYVMTHDSIGLGEDGPTHQPIEHIASLRVMPNMNVFRPCDAVETAECWELAIDSADTPSTLALSRQGLPTLRTDHTNENLCAKGAYVLADADGERQVTLVATGSEVEIAMAAREKLQADGIAAAVVSMPCCELFDAQSDAYRDEVLPPNAVTVAVEAAAARGWERYVGNSGGIVGMTGFGASAPAPQLYEHFGITADAAADLAKSLIAQ